MGVQYDRQAPTNLNKSNPTSNFVKLNLHTQVQLISSKMQAVHDKKLGVIWFNGIKVMI